NQLRYSLQLQTSTTMPFSAVIRPAVIRPLSVVRISPISRACYHNTPKSSYTNGAPSIYVAATFPDDSESPPLASERPKTANEAHNWDENLATLSEVAVKADRGDVQVNIQQQSKTSKTPKTPTMEDREPELDEM
ncbi:hypothetical protein N7519_001828, partial [Penicillium mononematosum]|uniref:uncharacterized protein n=1 Tax=Penicillium mononematosum TaxID=268346 RepID=UPI002546F534